MKLIESRILFEYLILAAYGLKVAIGQNPPSPCPDVFSYQQDGASWYGLITGRSSSYGDEIKTFIHMVYDGILKNGDLGRVVRLTSNEDLREVVARGGAIRYRLNFNVYPLPRLRKIVFNGSVVCESVLEDKQAEKLLRFPDKNNSINNISAQRVSSAIRQTWNTSTRYTLRVIPRGPQFGDSTLPQNYSTRWNSPTRYLTTNPHLQHMRNMNSPGSVVATQAVAWSSEASAVCGSDLYLPGLHLRTDLLRPYTSPC